MQDPEDFVVTFPLFKVHAPEAVQVFVPVEFEAAMAEVEYEVRCFMEFNFQVIAGVAAGVIADTCEIDGAKNDNTRVVPNTYGTNFFISLNLTGSLFKATKTTELR